MGGSTRWGVGVWVENVFTICIMKRARFIIEGGAAAVVWVGSAGGGACRDGRGGAGRAGVGKDWVDEVGSSGCGGRISDG
jgi:hypothetical protein